MKKNTGHKNNLVISLIFYLLSLVLFSCTQPNPQNPFDPETEISSNFNLICTILEVGSIKLEWNDNFDNEAVYEIERKENSGSWQNIANLLINITEYIDNNFHLDATIQYRLRIVFDENSSNYEQSDTINPFPVPHNLSYEIINPYNIQLSWEYEIEGIDGFVIARKVGTHSWNNNFVEVGFEFNEWTDDNMDPEEIYYYKVRAKYASYYSDYSNEVMYDNTIFEWCEVPAGDYTFGSNDEIQNIPYDFHIVKNEVTNEQYVAYLEEALSQEEITVSTITVEGYYSGDEHWEPGTYEFLDLDDQGCRIEWIGSEFIIDSDYEDHPVVEVTWFGSWAFAEHYGFELPTEQEWEKAARGDTGYNYPWGDNMDGSMANYSGSGDPFDNGTTPTGYYNGQNYGGFQTTDSPSETYGVYDMAGNVWEWCDSFYGGSFPSNRVRRGGGWSTYANDLQSWNRPSSIPAGSYNNIGFRCVRP
jgi:formylglycine-generating enzyme required for sulfatase activity